MSDLDSVDCLEGAMIVNKAVGRVGTDGVKLGTIAHHVVERQDGAHERVLEIKENSNEEGEDDDDEEDEGEGEDDDKERSGKKPRINTHKVLRMAGKSLELAINPQPFCCGGAVTVEEVKAENSGFYTTTARSIPALQVRIDASAEWVDAGSILEPDMSVLLKISKPAAFGDLETQTTKFDESVRKALDLQPDCWRCISTVTATTKPEPPRNCWPYYGGAKSEPTKEKVEVTPELLKDNKAIIQAIQRDVAARLNQNVQLIPHKINIYSEGGFFKAHVDTPIHKDMIGTVVIALPVPHKGGDLEISHGDTTHNAQFAIDSPDAKLRWVGFYSDCKHEVKPVLEGHRITMTFTMLHSTERIYATSSEESYAGPVDPASVIAHINKLPDFLSEMDRAHNKVGILLSQKYTLGGLQPNGLKGLDKQIYEALKTHFDCTLKSVVVTSYFSAYSEDSDPEFAMNVYDFDRSEILRLLGKSTAPKPPSQDCEFFDLAGGTQLKHEHQQGADHTGNEAMPETIEATYLSAALLLN